MSMREYKIIRKIGAEGRGQAYLCHKVNDPQHEFVMKTTSLNGLGVENDKVNMKIQEADVLKGLSCPFMVKCEDAFIHQRQVEDSGRISYLMPVYFYHLVIVTEYCGCEDLKKQIEEHKKNGTSFNENAVKNIFYQMAIALNHCHSQNVFHGDVKPENIFASKDNTYKLGDFACGKVLEKDIPLDKVHYDWAATYYGAPETWDGKQYGYQADIWALGCVMYEVMNLHGPFEQKGVFPLMQAISKAEFKPLRTNFSLKLRDLVVSMLSVDPNQRPSTEQILEHEVLQDVKQQYENQNEKLIGFKAPHAKLEISSNAKVRSPLSLCLNPAHEEQQSLEKKPEVSVQKTAEPRAQIETCASNQDSERVAKKSTFKKLTIAELQEHLEKLQQEQ